MTVVRRETLVDAPPHVVFDYARDIDLHVESMGSYDERAVAGVTSGLIGAGEEVTWRARHFGVPLTLTVEVVELEPPRFFRDVMTRGPLRRLVHDHHFEPADAATRMVDVFEYELPLGALGRLADRMFVRRRFEQLLAQRAATVKAAAERVS